MPKEELPEPTASFKVHEAPGFAVCPVHGKRWKSCSYDDDTWTLYTFTYGCECQIVYSPKDAQGRK